MDQAQRSDQKWRLAVLWCVFFGLFVWLRLSVLWQNRWTGFIFGAAMALASLAINVGRMGCDVRRRSYYLGWAIFFFAIGTAALASFFLGPGSGNDAFVGFLSLSFAIHQTWMYRWATNQDHSKDVKEL